MQDNPSLEKRETGRGSLFTKEEEIPLTLTSPPRGEEIPEYRLLTVIAAI
jgi:hypothetical protein